MAYIVILTLLYPNSCGFEVMAGSEFTAGCNDLMLYLYCSHGFCLSHSCMAQCIPHGIPDVLHGDVQIAGIDSAQDSSPDAESCTKPNAFLIPLAMPLRPPKASCHSSNMSNLFICCQCTGTFLANICSSGKPSPHSLTWRKPSRSAPTSINTPRLQTQKWKTRNEKGSIAKVFNMRLLDKKTASIQNNCIIMCSVNIYPYVQGIGDKS